MHSPVHVAEPGLDYSAQFDQVPPERAVARLERPDAQSKLGTLPVANENVLRMPLENIGKLPPYLVPCVTLYPRHYHSCS